MTGGAFEREDFDRVIRLAKETGLGFLVEHGSVSPLAHLLCRVNAETGKPGKSEFVVGMVEISPPDREGLLLGLCRDLQAEAVIQLLEVWHREFDHAHIRNTFPEAPTEREAFDRWMTANYAAIRETIEPREALMVLGEFHQHAERHILMFTRDLRGNPIPGTWKKVEGQMKGRFADLLPGARGE